MTLLLSCLLASFAGQAQDAQLLKQADSLWQSGQVLEAGTLYERAALEFELASALSASRLAQAYELQNRPDEALWALLLAQRLDGRNSLQSDILNLQDQLGSVGTFQSSKPWFRRGVGYGLAAAFVISFGLWLLLAHLRRPLLLAMLLCGGLFAAWLLAPRQQNAVVVQEEALLLTEASGAADLLQRLPKGSIVQHQASEGGWLLVQVNGRQGYVRPELLRSL